MGTLGTIASGAMQNLIHRAASVALKEERKLVLCPRETPLSTIHLENMLTLRRAGATILFLAPGFYHGAESVDDLVDFVAARALDHIGLENALVPRWGQQCGADPRHVRPGRVAGSDPRQGRKGQEGDARARRRPHDVRPHRAGL